MGKVEEHLGMASLASSCIQKKCIRFCKFGHDGLKGCNNKDCKFLHPLLCSNSVRYRKCFDANCNSQHLHGTDRNESRQKHFSNRKSNASVDHAFGNRDFSRKWEFPAENQQKRQPQAFNYSNADFPLLPTPFEDHQNWSSSADFFSAFKSLHQDVSLLKQHLYAKDGTGTNQSSNGRAITNQDMSKNSWSQTTRQGQ